MDNLFGIEPACQVFKAFCKFNVSLKEEPTVMALIWPEAFITATVNSFKEINSGSANWEGLNNNDAMIEGSNRRVNIEV